MRRTGILTLIAVFSAFLCLQAQAQDSSLGSISIGSLTERGEKAAVSVAAKLKSQIPDEVAYCRDNFVIIGSPTFDVKATENGAFDKANTGIDMFGFSDPSIGFFLANVGVEASRNFDSYAGLLELGWNYMRQKDESVGAILVNAVTSEAPLFALQCGYKFQRATNDTTSLVSDQDRSQEDEDSVLARVKFEAALSIAEVNKRMEKMRKAGMNRGAFGSDVDFLNSDYFSVNPNICGKAWVDAANGDFYHQETLGVEVGSKKFAKTQLGKLIFKKGKLDFSYNWGSGEPLFNRGEYFSAALKMEL